VIESGTATLPEVPTKRAVWRIALTTAIATTALISLVIGGYMVYDAKTNEISDLKQQRQRLSATNETLSAENETLSAEKETLNGQLASTRTDLRKTDAKLTKTTARLESTRKDLREMGGDLAAANERADANYSEGYGAGNTDGYSDGRDAGVNEATDELFCSDDPDAGLPACSLYDY
jgi:septal ring factor EnvC (AmiA/AmiB activator)